MPIERVSGTKIFGRVDNDRQFIVYEMRLSTRSFERSAIDIPSAISSLSSWKDGGWKEEPSTFDKLEEDEELAMILPIPTLPGSHESAVEFIDLEGYSDFFHDMQALFAYKMPRFGGGGGKGASRSPKPQLIVHDVGAFEASFVPSIGDFARLDDRFKLDDSVWESLPGYHDYGFAVFKLKGGTSKNVHPMAFSFPTRAPEHVFFPTVHVHDGAVHEQERFDHVLYAQVPSELTLEDVTDPFGMDWQESRYEVSRMMSLERSKGILSPEQKCMKRKIYGMATNRDQWLKLSGS